MMKTKSLMGLFGVVLLTMACALGIPITAQPQINEVGTADAVTMQVPTATPIEGDPTQFPTQTQMGGIPISFEHVSFVIPNGLAGGADTEAVPAIDEGGGAPWEVAPAHVKFTLTGYQLQGKFHEPGLFVYPADEYAQVNSSAMQEIDHVKKILAGSPILEETLPRVPWFNAEHLIAANIQIIPFQNGSGVRTLTEYAQYYAPINNRELFYHFEGLTSDGNYYIIAILPITAPILAEDEKPEATVPEGGVPIPTDIDMNNVYYSSVTEKLNSLSPDSYTPALHTLDALIQSILVTNP